MSNSTSLYPRRSSRMSRKPRVVSIAVGTPRCCNIAFVATVVPKLMTATCGKNSERDRPSAPAANSRALMTARASSPGIDGTLPCDIRPSSSCTTKSVKVPPTSIPTLYMDAPTRAWAIWLRCGLLRSAQLAAGEVFGGDQDELSVLPLRNADLRSKVLAEMRPHRAVGEFDSPSLGECPLGNIETHRRLADFIRVILARFWQYVFEQCPGAVEAHGREGGRVVAGDFLVSLTKVGANLLRVWRQFRGIEIHQHIDGHHAFRVVAKIRSKFRKRYPRPAENGLCLQPQLLGLSSEQNGVVRIVRRDDDIRIGVLQLEHQWRQIRRSRGILLVGDRLDALLLKAFNQKLVDRVPECPVLVFDCDPQLVLGHAQART